LLPGHAPFLHIGLFEQQGCPVSPQQMPLWQRLLQEPPVTQVCATVSQQLPGQELLLQHARVGAPHDWQDPPLQTVPAVPHWLPASTQVPPAPVQQSPPLQACDAQQISVVLPHAVHVPPEHT
jgi:hypothetical protein